MAKKEIFNKLKPVELLDKYEDNSRSLNYRYSVKESETLYEHKPMVNKNGNGLIGIKPERSTLRIFGSVPILKELNVLPIIPIPTFLPHIFEDAKRKDSESRQPPTYLND